MKFQFYCSLLVVSVLFSAFPVRAETVLVSPDEPYIPTCADGCCSCGSDSIYSSANLISQSITNFDPFTVLQNHTQTAPLPPHQPLTGIWHGRSW